MHYHHFKWFCLSTALFLVLLLYLLLRKPEKARRWIATVLCLGCFGLFCFQILPFTPTYDGTFTVSYVEYQGKKVTLPQELKRPQSIITQLEQAPLQLDPMRQGAKGGKNYYHIKVKTPEGTLHLYVEKTYDKSYAVCSRGTFLLTHADAKEFFRVAENYFE